jgi:hypothetical protein
MKYPKQFTIVVDVSVIFVQNIEKVQIDVKILIVPVP